MTVRADDPAPFHLGPWTVDPIANEIQRGEAVTRLEPKTTAVLVHLAARAGEVVTREELLAAVWPDVVVTDASLTRCVSQLRQALGDDSRQPRLIETLPTVGYRLLQAPTGMDAPRQLDDAAARPARPLWAWGFGLAATVIALGLLWQVFGPSRSDAGAQLPTVIAYQVEVSGTLSAATVAYTDSSGATVTDADVAFPYTRTVAHGTSPGATYRIQVAGAAENAEVRLRVQALQGDSVLTESRSTGTARDTQRFNIFAFLTLDP